MPFKWLKWEYMEPLAGVVLVGAACRALTWTHSLQRQVGADVLFQLPLFQGPADAHRHGHKLIDSLVTAELDGARALTEA